MTRALLTALALGVALASCFVPMPAVAQRTLFRRPYTGDYPLRYGRDDDERDDGRCHNYDCDGCSSGLCYGNCYDGHSGTDFGLPFGRAVRAAAPGRVTSRHNTCPDVGFRGSTCGGGCGNHVELRHADGSRTRYCHMRMGSVTVRLDDRVDCGDILGEVASSGNSTGNHLHFGLIRPGETVSFDPFEGACGAGRTWWVDQTGGGGLPSTECQCIAEDERCNNRDDDCDGRIDDGLSRACSTACGSGTETCSRGTWGACDAPMAGAETCDALDEDCDGLVDEGLMCASPDGGAPDVGPPVDVDAGLSIDAGLPIDAALPVDAGPRVDAGLRMDAGLRDDAGPIRSGALTGGCGCSVGARPTLPWALVVSVLAMAVRRRRARSTRVR